MPNREALRQACRVGVIEAMLQLPADQGPGIKEDSVENLAIPPSNSTPTPASTPTTPGPAAPAVVTLSITPSLYSGLPLMQNWEHRQYAPPSPPFVKLAVLTRLAAPAATWVETGTFLGDTTEVLARTALQVYSVEPGPALFAKAQVRFAATPNVRILNGVSETVFPTLLPTLSGDVNFWLDGHYSAGETFQGEKDTPIVEELRLISLHLARFGKLAVFVDDVRCFDPADPQFAHYPSIDFLVDWARANRLAWHIEHDIFVARNF